MFRSPTPLFAFVFSLLAFALAFPVSIRDVFVPHITSPKKHAIWFIGSQQNVTWDTSNAPVNITNPTGKIVLATNDLLDLKNPLATNFPILKGWEVVTVPDIEVNLGDRYSIVLFGDSGNMSPPILIFPMRMPSL